MKRLPLYLIIALVLALFIVNRFFTPPFVAIPSTSMLPALHVGDLALVKNVKPEDIKVGDVVVVTPPSESQSTLQLPASVIHRVVKVDNSGPELQFRIKGDNNNAEDPYTLTGNNIKGKMYKSYRYAGYAILFLYSQQGMYFLLAVLGMYILYEVSNYLNKRKKSLLARFVPDTTKEMEAELHEQTEKLNALHQEIRSLKKYIEDLQRMIS
ncbi:signal peptidase I [Ectobacillus ponti]|uniref:Signal peptidase I n=1 Tax=Ectobacillus ponti TaxID=2961894 RepID=A0AA41XAP5_9BACI|nr:signal peptidase I [Ectobacillus ponti]MCP8970010.1 signal peptidase I [Ectobacillus ponti]